MLGCKRRLSKSLRTNFIPHFRPGTKCFLTDYGKEESGVIENGGLARESDVRQQIDVRLFAARIISLVSTHDRFAHDGPVSGFAIILHILQKKNRFLKTEPQNPTSSSPFPLRNRRTSPPARRRDQDPRDIRHRPTTRT